MGKPLRTIAEHFYTIWTEELNSKLPDQEKKTPIIFQFLPPSQQDAWERVAREACMESASLSEIKKVL